MSNASPTFQDIVNLLNNLVPLSDQNINRAPHEAFWRNIDRNAFVSLTTDDWGVPGPLVTVGAPAQSNLYLALAGAKPFDGSGCPRMPDVSSDSNSRFATAAELALVGTWIKNNAPA